MSEQHSHMHGWPTGPIGPPEEPTIEEIVAMAKEKLSTENKPSELAKRIAEDVNAHLDGDMKDDFVEMDALVIASRIAPLEAENAKLKSVTSRLLICGDCKVPYDVSIDSEPCGLGHEADWSHDWRTRREHAGWDKYLLLESALAASQAERERLREDGNALRKHALAYRQQVETAQSVINAARRLWLFSRGYVSEGVEIRADINDEAIEEEEAARSLSLYRAVEAYDAALSAQPAAETTVPCKSCDDTGSYLDADDQVHNCPACR